MICKLKCDWKVLVGIALAFALVLACISLWGNDTPNENIWTYRNTGNASIGEFMVEAGEQIQYRQERFGWRIYKVKLEIAHSLERKPKLHLVVVYYE